MRKIILAAAFISTATAALAHHGWDWADEQQSELSGTVKEVYVGPPHPRLQVDTGADGIWQVDLGNPNQTATAGFTDASTKAGDQITITGNRSKKQGEKLIKAVKVNVAGKDFVFYPQRLK
jgi:hypothetical protein